jgi:hypothetical protein
MGPRDLDHPSMQTAASCDPSQARRPGKEKCLVNEISCGGRDGRKGVEWDKAKQIQDRIRGAITPVTANPTIVVVDDDPAALKLASLALRARWGTTRCAARIPKTRAPDPDSGGGSAAVVIVNLLMSDVDGFAFVSPFRAMASGRDGPILVWTIRTWTPPSVADCSR